MQWVTQERVQVDRLASAWLIARFVDSAATFAFVPRGTLADQVAEGTPFHLPGTEPAHRDGRSTFETILDRYGLAVADPTLAELGRIVRAADTLHGPVAFRGVPVQEALPPEAPPETAGLQAALHGVRLQATDDHDAIDRASAVLDAVHAALRARAERVASGGDHPSGGR